MKKKRLADVRPLSFSVVRGTACTLVVAALSATLPSLIMAADAAPAATAQQVQTADAAILRDVPTANLEWRRLPLSQTDLRFEPLVRSQRELAGLLTGQPLVRSLTSESMERLMQVVPGLPPGDRYGDAKYTPIRDSFSAACLNSAKNYRGRSQLLWEALAAGPAVTWTSFPSSFDTNCLTPLKDLPVPLKRVVGILLDKDGKAFCSATITGARTVLTSRHCFVRGEDGAEEPNLEQLFTEQISLQTAEQHHGRDSFSIAAPDAAALPLAPFVASDDYLVLRVKSWDLQYQVATDPVRLPEGKNPIPAWIIGSNPTLADVGQAKTAMDFTRGSKPQACAILEVSAKGCVYHSCQTGPATSGAGILVYDESKPADPVRLLGVHKGPVASAKSCDGSPPVDLQVNLATAIGAGELNGK